jgi:NAD(P)-dependent dehydrogenase (short-subunit alcohol dehydrogenase family)
MKHVVVTGVSTGIGRAVAEELAGSGHHVFGSVRRSADGQELAECLGDRFTPRVFVVTAAEGVRAAAARVAEVVGEGGLTGLVNNAGIARGGPLLHQPLEDFRAQFEVNLFGLLRVTQVFLPLLGARRPCPHPPGRIVNLSSVGGRVTFPFLGGYAATKHAVEALSDALRRELSLYGIAVTVLEPGAVQTEIWDKAEERGIRGYEETDYAPILRRFQKVFLEQGRAGLPAAMVGRAVRQALEAPRPPLRRVLVRNRLTDWWLPRYLPGRWLDRLVTGRLRLRQRPR